ncbi:MAG TPA: hypothetical protein VM553_02050 [Dongiaceae bacterium]|nr:hypothetical protein [Dongiaceae bacterium]
MHSSAAQEQSATADPLQLKKDAEALWQRAEQQESTALLQDAIAAYERLLQLAPQDSTLQYQLYDGYYRLAVAGIPNVEDRMRALFTQLPAPMREMARPPSLAVFLQAIKQAEATQQYDDAHLSALLLAAIGEQPSEPATYVLLSDGYLRSQHPVMAIATAKQGLARNPHNPASHKYLGQAYRAFVRSQSCLYSYRDEIQKAAEALRVASTGMPDDLKIREQLVDIYALMNLAPLSVNEARKLHTARPDDTSTWFLAQALTDVDQYAQSDELYLTLVDRHPDIMYEALADNAALRGDWDSASGYWAKHFFHARKPDFYAALLRSVADEQAYGQQAALKIFATLTEAMDVSPWQAQLREFRLSRLPQDRLIAAARDTCERTEAYFYAGYTQRIQGNANQANEYFRAAANEKTYSYQEYLLAHYFLKH